VVPAGATPNASRSEGWLGTGRMLRFDNAELRHDFAHCRLGRRARRFRRSAPRALEAELLLVLPDGGGSATIPLRLCRVEQPMHEVSFCSLPLYKLDALQRQVPWVMEDWLAYHLGHLGFGRADIYDVDGSAARHLARWRQRGGAGEAHGEVAYWPLWPSNLSASIAATSVEHPYCSETWAYAHCVTTHRALSHWVMLLHGPDEYAVIPGSRAPGALPRLLRRLGPELSDPSGVDGADPLTSIIVSASSFARGGPGAAHDPSARGFVLDASYVRGEVRYQHTPLVRPAHCVMIGPHTCYAEAGKFGGLTTMLDPKFLLVHHYVEMLDRDAGRCASQHSVCNVPDDTAAWVAQELRR